MNQEIAASAATFHVLHAMEKQHTLWRVYGVCGAFLKWQRAVDNNKAEPSVGDPGKQTQTTPVPAAVPSVNESVPLISAPRVLERLPPDVSYIWEGAGRLGILLHSKTVHPLGAIVKSTNLPEVSRTLEILNPGVNSLWELTRLIKPSLNPWVRRWRRRWVLQGWRSG